MVKAQNLISKSPINKNNFGNIFKDAIDKVKPESIINGFKACGMFPFNPDAVDYIKCIPNRQNEVDIMFQEQQHALECPRKDEYLVWQKVIKYILKNQTINNTLSNEPFLKKIWNTCNEEIVQISNESSFGSQPFNILDMPIELEGSNFNFDEEVMEDLGVKILNSDSVYKEEHLHEHAGDNLFLLNTNTETQYLNEQVSIYSQIDRQRIQFPGEENVNLDNEDCNVDPQIGQELQYSGKEDIDLVKEGCNVVPHMGEQDVQHLNKGNCNINIQLDEQETQHLNEKNCNTVSLKNGQEDIQCLDSIKAPNLSIEDQWVG
ncbi:hypothetical protein AGLY_014219 [Aphis glycines]|uniref:Uncharacterized protein n=1 Tax=Aphis glycines TaxID=307491 RepID=A0A6G0T6I9_APHGL|nr:hypothetical protein AGLY_014219 [Aphis glycines]